VDINNVLVYSIALPNFGYDLDAVGAMAVTTIKIVAPSCLEMGDGEVKGG